MTNVLFALCGVGILTAFAGWAWLVLQITRSRPFLGIIALFVPFFTWLYAFQNWDAAKRPFLTNVGGIAMWLGFGLAAAFASSP
jgi:hypothetical protein